MKELSNRLAIAAGLFALSTVAFAGKKSAKKLEKNPIEPAPEMRIDPNLITTYQTGANVESKQVESADIQFVAIEPTIDFHQFHSFKSKNDYFEVPLNGGATSTVAPSVWLGHPTGAVWGKLIRARLGLSLSYLANDGAQTVNQRSFDMEFRDNISSVVIPLMASLRFNSAARNESTMSLSPWVTAGAGMMLTQVTGNLDGVSQNSWTPITRLSGGLKYSISGTSGLVGGIQAGVFAVSGSSKKAEWRGTGLTLGADLVL